MALWFAVQGAATLPTAIAAKMAYGDVTLNDMGRGPVAELFIESAYLLMPACLLIFSAILFYGASFFSRMLTRNPDIELRPLSAKQLFKIGALLIGIKVALDYLPSLIAKLALEFQSKSMETGQSDMSALIANIVGLLLAIGLSVWAIYAGKNRGEATEP